MCGILGMAFQKGHTMKDSEEVQEIWRRLLVESNVRGSNATGCAFINLHEAMVIKHNIPSRRFVDTNYYKTVVEKRLRMNGDHVEPLVVLGHTRLKTKGEPTNTHNNHPILTNRVIGVHNGVISNDDAIFDIYKMYRKAQVDSEVIFRLIEHHIENDNEMEAAIKKTAKVLLGGFACATVQVDIPWVLWLFRSGNPIYAVRYPKRGLILFASVEKFVEVATVGFDLGESEEIFLLNNEAIGINVLQNRRVRINIDKVKAKGQKQHGNT